MPYVVTLTASDIEFGKQITEGLKQFRFPYKGVLWLYDEANDDWQLIIATDLVDSEGPRKTYLRLSKITAKVTGLDFQRLKVSVISPRTPWFQSLHSVFGSAASVEGARLHHTVVNGTLISDAYLYEIR